MDEDRETATFDLTKGEARVVIAALAEAETTASGDRERHLRSLQDHLAAEFDFDEYRSDRGEMADDGDWFLEEWFDDDLLGDEGETIELSREEADDVTDALADFELEEDNRNAGVADDVRERIDDAFDEE